MYDREGWRERLVEQIARGREEAGFEFLRGHGVLCDQVGMYRGPGQYDFTRLDRIYDRILGAGMRPFVELSFMPEKLRSTNRNGFPTGYKPYISPPNDYDEWREFIRAFVAHCYERYGEDEVRNWYWEVWNEPNLKLAFFDGEMEDYWRLYDTTVKAVRSVDPEARVGGPASSEFAWIPEMIAHAKSSGAPLDFISTHVYPNNFYDRKWYMDAHGDEWPWPFGFLVRDAQEKMKAYPEPLELWITEWNTHVSPLKIRWTPETYHELPNGAAMVCQSARDVNGFCEGFSFWTISDIFEELSLPGERWINRRATFHGGFGLFNIDGVPKPTYWAFVLLNRLDDDMLSSEFSDKPFGVDVLATRSDKRLSVLLWNYHHPLFPERVKDLSVDLKIEHVPDNLNNPVCNVYRIDQTHGNPIPIWESWGRPKNFTPAQLEEIKERSDNVLVDSGRVEIKGNTFRARVDLPAESVVMYEFTLD
jgi:xylan 1,4-beta-xylosidase